MKRPGGFDREPEGIPEAAPVARPAPEPAPSFFSRPTANPRRTPAPVPDGVGAASPAATAPGDGAADPDAQLTDVIDHLDELSDPGDLAGADLGDGAVDGTAAGSAVESSNPDAAPTAIGDAKASVSRALAWAGVGVPKDPVQAADRRVRAATRLRRRRERRERHRFARDLRRQRRGWLITGGVIAALMAFVAVCAFTPVTAVHEVRVEGAQSVREADVVRALSRFDGVPLALVDDAEVHRALEVFPLIQRYQVERIPPHTLVVQITERVPVITIEHNGTFDQFDAAGVKVGSGKAPAAGVPVGAGAITDRASPAFAAAARVVRDQPAELRARVVSITATSAQDVTLTLDNGLQVTWGGDADTQRKSVVLQSMLTALADRPIENIDVSSPYAPVFR